MKVIIDFVRKIGILKWILKAEGEVGVHHYLLNPDEVAKLYKKALPADIIVCNAPFELSTIQQDLVSECEFTHATFVHDTETISDMTTVVGLSKRIIWNTAQGNNRIALLRKIDIKEEEREDLCLVADQLIEHGAEYDFDFSLKNNTASKAKKAMYYCSEYCYKIYTTVFPDCLGLKKQLSELVITPTDLYKSKSFYIVEEIKGHK